MGREGEGDDSLEEGGMTRGRIAGGNEERGQIMPHTPNQTDMAKLTTFNSTIIVSTTSTKTSTTLSTKMSMAATSFSN